MAERTMARLSPREREVLALAAQGFSDQQIGKRIFCTRSTVARHVHNLLMKLGARNRTHAVALGMRDGLIRWEGSDG